MNPRSTTPDTPVELPTLGGEWPSIGFTVAMWLLAICLAVGGLLLRALPQNLILFHWLNGLGPRWGTVASWGSVLGLGAVPLLVAAAAGPRRSTAAAAVLLALIVCGVLVQLLKYTIDEARPLAVLGPASMQIVGAQLRGRSMPSGHAAAGACAASMMWCSSRAHRRWLMGALLLSVLAIVDACSRVVVGAHWPSDVLCGAGLGVAAGWLVCVPRASRQVCERLGQWVQRPAGALVLALLIVLAAGSLWHSRGDYPEARLLYLGFSMLGVGVAVRWLVQVLARTGAVKDGDGGGTVGAG